LRCSSTSAVCPTGSRVRSRHVLTARSRWDRSSARNDGSSDGSRRTCWKSSPSTRRGRLTLRSQGGPLKLTIDHQLEPRGGATRLTVVASGKPGKMLKLAGPMIERTAREEITGDFARLKELLEA
jgi:hypothetical protein